MQDQERIFDTISDAFGYWVLADDLNRACDEQRAEFIAFVCHTIGLDITFYSSRAIHLLVESYRQQQRAADGSTSPA